MRIHIYIEGVKGSPIIITEQSHLPEIGDTIELITDAWKAGSGGLYKVTDRRYVYTITKVGMSLSSGIGSGERFDRATHLELKVKEDTDIS